LKQEGKKGGKKRGRVARGYRDAGQFPLVTVSILMHPERPWKKAL
jgi:hypothetical protein